MTRIAPDEDPEVWPPVEALSGLPVVADHAVSEDPEITFSAGSHSFGVRVDRATWQRAAAIRYADLAENRPDIPAWMPWPSLATASRAPSRSGARRRGGRPLLPSRGRARRGTSGALYLQSAPAGLNSPSRSPFSKAAATSDVEDWVPRSGDPRTVSGPEGSSTKRPSTGAAERPGPSRSWSWARKRPGRQGVHGTQRPSPHHRRVTRGEA